ncbi:hypothetical protein [Aestuariispira insulae]|nr:hypothetical protein [Aestuariispira insulae]
MSKGEFLCAFLPSAVFWGAGGWLIASPGLQFLFETNVAPVVDWALAHQAGSLAFLFLFVSLGSLADHMLLRDGAGKQPLLALILSLIVVGFLALGFGVYLTGTYFTPGHESFFITMIIFTVKGALIWFWAYSRF